MANDNFEIEFLFATSGITDESGDCPTVQDLLDICKMINGAEFGKGNLKSAECRKDDDGNLGLWVTVAVSIEYVMPIGE